MLSHSAGCSPGAGAEFLPSPDDLSPALLAEILSR